MRTSELCNTWKPADTRSQSIWEQAGDILFSKSSRQRKTPLDGRFDERSDRGGRAILRFWWPIRRKLKECGDGPPNAISPTLSRVRGPGCRKNRAAREQSPSGFSSLLVPQCGPDRESLGSGPLLFYYNDHSIYLVLGVLLRLMASVTTRPHDDPGLARVAPETIALPLPSALATVLIEPPRGWIELHIHEVWQYHELLYFFVWRNVKIRYKQTVIGIAWVVLQPLMTMGVFTLFFGRLAKLPSDGLPYPVFYFAALVPWTYFSTALQSCTSVVVDNQNVITKVYFPRLILPLSAVISGLVDFAIGFVVLLVVTAIYGIKPTLAALWLPVLLLLAVLTALGVGLWMSALNALYRDVLYVVPFLVQCWMFASPVAHPSSLVPHRWGGLCGFLPICRAGG